jgi:hypothetical protein
MIKKQIVSISFFKFEKATTKWKALQSMGRSPGILSEVEGLSFGKMLGSGSGNGFSVLPNLGVYGLLGVWKDEAAAQQFIRNHSFFHQLRDNAGEVWTTFLQTTMVHGEWEGNCPFEVTVPFDKDNPVAVLTRATIRNKRLLHFWKHVPKVSRSMDEHKEGLIFSVGVGELPLVQQATISFWQNSHLMQAYAYNSRFHKEVIQKTRSLGWYKEELFARFLPYKSEGSWNGENPLAEYLMVEGRR